MNDARFTEYKRKDRESRIKGLNLLVKNIPRPDFQDEQMQKFLCESFVDKLENYGQRHGKDQEYHRLMNWYKTYKKVEYL